MGVPRLFAPGALSPVPASPQGRDFPFDDCGRAFTCLPVENAQAPVEAVVCNLDRLLDIMSYQVRLQEP